MERTNPPVKLVLPDAINCSSQTNFTQIPNHLLRNPNISAKAKTILTILLSNKEGWHSCISYLLKMMKEGKAAIQAGVQELEENKYLLRIRYRCKKTKVWQGSFWAYTDSPGKFQIEEHLLFLDKKGLEIKLTDTPEPDYPDMAYPDMENQPIIISIYNNTKEKNILPPEEEVSTKYITPNLFNLFWKLYPRKVDKGKVSTIWNNLCKKGNKRPLWLDIRKAIHLQKKSERWQNPIFIPLPATWLNQSRWIDDPEEMKNFTVKEKETLSCPHKGIVFGKGFSNKERCRICEDNDYKLYRRCELAHENL